MNLDWGTCGDNGSWCGFLDVNLDDPYFDRKEGVYIIWQGNGGPIIKIGQGVIRDRLLAHRRDEAIICYGKLFVTWAETSVQDRDGIECFLGNRLNPRVGDAFPSVVQIEVNLPWPY